MFNNYFGSRMLPNMHQIQYEYKFCQPRSPYPSVDIRRSDDGLFSMIGATCTLKTSALYCNGPWQFCKGTEIEIEM